jgi:hypothetical protein
MGIGAHSLLLEQPEREAAGGRLDSDLCWKAKTRVTLLSRGL